MGSRHRAARAGTFGGVESRQVGVSCRVLRDREGRVVLTLRSGVKSFVLGDGFAVDDAAGRELAQVGSIRVRLSHTLRTIRSFDGLEATLRLPHSGAIGGAGVLDESDEMIACLHCRADSQWRFMVEMVPGVAWPIRAVAAVAPMIWCSRIWSA
jgi:hypothetical protein